MSGEAARRSAMDSLAEAVRSGRTCLSESESRSLLRAYGIESPPELLLVSGADLPYAAAQLRWPIAMKVDSPDIPHKSDLGLVRLNVPDLTAAQAAFEELLRLAAQSAPHARVDGVLAQEMVIGGLECLAGIKTDEHFGPVVLFGTGGIYSEIFDDVSLRVCPVTPADAAEMIRETKVGRLIAGVRGRPRGDAAALTRTLLALSEMAAEMESLLLELDINPLLVLPEGRGVLAADALAILHSQPQPEPPKE